MTSPPERVLSFDMRERLKLETGEHGRVRGEVELRQIFALQVKREGFLRFRGLFPLRRFIFMPPWL